MVLGFAGAVGSVGTGKERALVALELCRQRRRHQPHREFGDALVNGIAPRRRDAGMEAYESDDARQNPGPPHDDS
jgi:hypothetical protein